MSGSIASTSATQSATQASGTTASSNPLGSLTDNFQTFLTMLTTQLQNQDPTSPMDSSQFTTELVQFAGVEQQINTNSSLNQLVALAQGNSVLNGSQILGKQVQATSSELSLQQGTAQVDFTAPSAGQVVVAVANSAGATLYSGTAQATAGANTWTWNGQTTSGATMPDGAYTVSVASVAADGTQTPLPFTIVGTATSVQQQGANVTLQLGALSVAMSAVTSVGN